jgi:hypothetical protein
MTLPARFASFDAEITYLRQEINRLTDEHDALKAEMAFDAILHADREHDLTCEWERANAAEAEVTLLKATRTDNAIHYADCLRNLQHERDRADEAEVQVLLARTELSHLLVHRVLQALPQEAPANRQVET